MELKKGDSRRIQESPFECLNIIPLFFICTLQKVQFKMVISFYIYKFNTLII